MFKWIAKAAGKVASVAKTVVAVYEAVKNVVGGGGKEPSDKEKVIPLPPTPKEERNDAPPQS